MDRCVLFGALPVSRALVQQALRDAVPRALVVTADAGWEVAVGLGLQVDLAVGDFDSSPEPGADAAAQVLRLPAEKDETDLFCAVRQALAMGCEEFTILGALGGRADQTMASFATLLYLTKHGATGRLLAEDCTVYCTRPGEALFLEKDEERYLSVFCAGGKAGGVTLAGVRYPLDKVVLSPSVPLGVSNEFAAEQAEVKCETGYLFAMTVEKGSR